LDCRKARNNIIFCPDCDEVVEWNLKDIEEILDVYPDLIQFQYIYSFDSNKNPIYQFLYSKFYNREKLKWEGIIHEVLVEKQKHDYNNDIEGWTSQKELDFYTIQQAKWKQL